MSEEYKTLSSSVRARLAAKRLSFVADLLPAPDLSVAAERFSSVKRRHHEAKHNVYV